MYKTIGNPFGYLSFGIGAVLKDFGFTIGRIALCKNVPLNNWDKTPRVVEIEIEFKVCVIYSSI